MGVRGYFEEGYGGDQLIGSYFSGFYEEAPVNRQAAYKGLIDRARFMVNTVDWLFTRIEVDGEILDLARSKIRDYERTLDFQSGILGPGVYLGDGQWKTVETKFPAFREHGPA